MLSYSPTLYYKKVEYFLNRGLRFDEVVVFSWIIYKSRADRDAVNAKVMEDPRMKDMMDPKTLPFDGMRMFWGGFESIIEMPPGAM